MTDQTDAVRRAVMDAGAEVLEKLMTECIAEATRPDNSFNIRDVERLVAMRLGNRKVARKLVRAWEETHTIKPTAENRAKMDELMRLWALPEYQDCKTAGEVMARRARMARN